MGIEPTSEAWEAYSKARKRANWRHFCVFGPSSNGFQLERRDRLDEASGAIPKICKTIIRRFDSDPRLQIVVESCRHFHILSPW